MGKTGQENNVLRIQLSHPAIARRLGVTLNYVTYLLTGTRFNVKKLEEIRAIVASESHRVSAATMRSILSDIDLRIETAKAKGKG